MRELLIKNKHRTGDPKAVGHHANAALKEVNKYRALFAVKGRTPLKMVALLAMEQCTAAGLSKKEVLDVFEFDEVNMTRTR